MADEAVVVFEGTNAEAETLHAMLTARGVDSAVTRAREIEGGTAVIEAQIFVPPDQVEEALALIADGRSGDASAPD